MVDLIDDPNSTCWVLKRASPILFCDGGSLESIMVIKLVMFSQYRPTGKHERLLLNKNSELNENSYLWRIIDWIKGMESESCYVKYYGSYVTFIPQY